MVGLAAILGVAGAIAVVLWFMADRIESGLTQPNLGRHTEDGSTPQSWADARVAVSDAMQMGARWHAGAAVIGIGAAWFTGSTTSGISATAFGLAVASAPMVIGIIRACSIPIPRSPEGPATAVPEGG